MVQECRRASPRKGRWTSPLLLTILDHLFLFEDLIKPLNYLQRSLGKDTNTCTHRILHTGSLSVDGSWRRAPALQFWQVPLTPSQHRLVCATAHTPAPPAPLFWSCACSSLSTTELLAVVLIWNSVTLISDLLTMIAFHCCSGGGTLANHDPEESWLPGQHRFYLMFKRWPVSGPLVLGPAQEEGTSFPHNHQGQPFKKHRGEAARSLLAETRCASLRQQPASDFPPHHPLTVTLPCGLHGGWLFPIRSSFMISWVTPVSLYLFNIQSHFLFGNIWGFHGVEHTHQFSFLLSHSTAFSAL